MVGGVRRSVYVFCCAGNTIRMDCASMRVKYKASISGGPLGGWSSAGLRLSESTDKTRARARTCLSLIGTILQAPGRDVIDGIFTCRRPNIPLLLVLSPVW